MNTIDHLGKFAGKSDEGFLVGYSLQSKAFRVYNLETKRVEENLHITFLENKPNVAGKGPTWLFDLDYLTDSMNYHPVRSENQANLHAGQQEANQNAGTEDIIDAGDSEKEDESAQDCFVLPIWPSYSSTITPDLKTDEKREGPREEEQVFLDELERLKRQEKEANEEAEALRKKFEQETENLVIQEGAAKTSSTNIFSTVSTPAKASSTNLVNTVSIPVSTASPHEGLTLSDPTNPEQDDSEIPPLEDIYQNSSDGIFTTSSYDDEGAVADFTNLETVVNVSPIPTSRIHSSHPSALILGDPTSAVQTRSKVNKSSGAHAFVSYVQKFSKALEDESWVDAMQEELLQFTIQKVWVLVDLPYKKKAIGTKWVYRNKKDERGVVVRNKARLVAQGHKQEEDTQTQVCLFCESVLALNLGPSIFKINPSRRLWSWGVWDCQVGTYVAGKGSGGGGRCLSMEGMKIHGIRFCGTMGAKEYTSPTNARNRGQTKRRKMSYATEEPNGSTSHLEKTDMESGARDEDYFNKALLDYEAEFGVPFTLHHCWEVLKYSPKWLMIVLTCNVTLHGDDDENDVQGNSKIFGQGQRRSRLKKKGYGFFNKDVAKIACNKLYNENEAVVPIKVQVQLRPISMATAAAGTTAVKVLIKG
ncbi:putative ribonuclease H-like domain-containing protein [Tanacetum coccineum]